MYKRILSILITSCLLFNIFPVFGEEILQDNTKYGIINTEALTDENVIYNALQNNRVSLLDDTSDEIIADFDVVFGFDMSADMYKYDYNGDMAWLDEFKALEEQVPEGTRFATVSDEGFTQNIDIDGLKEKGYSGASDIISLLDSCMNTFDDSSADRNKIVIATASNISDSSALQNKMDEMMGYGVIPFVFVLNSEQNEQLDSIESIYQCANDLELRIAISDLYLSFAEFGSASTYSDTISVRGAVTYKSDFKDRHIIKANKTSSGKSLISVLNMYGCVPMRAKSPNAEYDMAADYSGDIQNFAKSNNIELSADAANGISSLWGDIYSQLEGNIIKKFNSNSIASAKQLIDKNLKRRFPVIIKQGSEYKVITKYNPAYSEATIRYSPSSSGTNINTETININSITDEYELFDTYEYLTKTASSVKFINDETKLLGSTVRLYSVYPTDYITKDNVTVKYFPENEENKGIMNCEFGGNSVTVNMKTASASADNRVVTTAKTTFTNGIADIYNQNRIYNLKAYKDVGPNDWYNDFLFKATNLGIINGDENGNFNGGNGVKRCEFVKMVLSAAQIDVTPSPAGEHWAKNYMDKAAELGILFWPSDADFNEEICRYEAAYILKELFMNKSDNINVSTLLYTYDDNIQSDQKASWDRVEDEFKNDSALAGSEQEKAKTAFYQMYMNNILVGNEYGKINPYAVLTKAEATKITIKPLFELDENLPQILVNFEENDGEETVTPITMDGYETTIDDIVFDGKGNRVFDFTIKSGDNYRYMIETIGDTVEGNTIGLDVKANGSGQTGQYAGSGKYYVQGEDTYTITVSKTGIANAGLHICAINAPQEVVFDRHTVDEDGTKVYNIFDDHPEHIRECDLMDGVYGEPNELNQGTALAKFETLGPGKYVVCSSHCIDNYLLTSGFKAISSDVYYDFAFYNSTVRNNVQITRLGYAGTHQPDNAWDKFTDNTNYNYGRFGDANPKWFSDILIDKKVNYDTLLSTGEWGSMELEMEFEVTDGTVDFITTAYHNKPSNEQFNEWKNNGQINAPYETLETLKGKGETRPKITANLEYYIDDSSYTGNEVRLPVGITNIFFKNRKLNFFTTNNTAFSANNRWNIVGSSTIPIEYKSYGIKNRNGDSNPNGDKVYSNENGTWYFNQDRIMEITDKNIPSYAQKGVYENRTEFSPNEKLDKDWLDSLVKNPDDASIIQYENDKFEERMSVFKEMCIIEAESQPGRWEGIYNTNPGYGLENEIVVTIHNLGQNDRVFNYIMDGQKITGTWTAINKSNNNTIDKNNIKLNHNKDDAYQQEPHRLFNITVPKNTTIEFHIQYTLICGGNPTVHHALALDIPENNFTDKLDTELKPYEAYTSKIYDREKLSDIVLYPQN